MGWHTVEDGMRWDAARWKSSFSLASSLRSRLPCASLILDSMRGRSDPESECAASCLPRHEFIPHSSSLAALCKNSNRAAQPGDHLERIDMAPSKLKTSICPH